MKLTRIGLAAIGLIALVPAVAQAEPNDRPPHTTPLLKIVTYDTGYGTANVSYIFGHPVTGEVRFRTLGERDTRREGFDHKGRRH